MSSILRQREAFIFTQRYEEGKGSIEAKSIIIKKNK